VQDIKLKYNRLLLQLHTHNKDTMALCRCFQAIYTTRNVASDRAVWQEALEGIVVFLALSPFDNEVSNLLHRFKTDPLLEELPAFKYGVAATALRGSAAVRLRRGDSGVGCRQLLTYLTTKEVIPWPMPAADVLRAHPVLAVDEWYTLLHKRIVQHVRSLTASLRRCVAASPQSSKCAAVRGCCAEHSRVGRLLRAHSVRPPREPHWSQRRRKRRFARVVL
jgi:hypothetical protein